MANVIAEVCVRTPIRNAGIGILVAGAKCKRVAAGDLGLANLTEWVQNVLLVIAQLAAVFKVFENTVRAVERFPSVQGC